MWEYTEKWLMKCGRTWKGLFFYNSVDCLSSEIMIFFQNVDYNYIFIF